MPLKTTAVKSIWRKAPVSAATIGEPGKTTPTPADGERRDQSHHEQPDRVGQVDEAVVDPAEQRRQAQQHAR